MSNPFRTPTSGGSFLPEDYIARKTEARANAIMLALFALVLAGVVGAFLVTHRSWQQVRARQLSVSRTYDGEWAQIDQIKTLEDRRAQMMEKAQLTSALVEKIPRWAMVGEVVLRRPKGVWLSQMELKGKRIDPPQPAADSKNPPPKVKNLTGKGKTPAKVVEKPKVLPPRFEYTLTLQGAAEENTDVADYFASLRNSPVLQNVDLQYIREAKEKDRLLRRFEIVAQLKGDPDTEAIAASLRGLLEARQETMDEGVKVKDGAGSASAAGGKEGQ